MSQIYTKKTKIVIVCFLFYEFSHKGVDGQYLAYYDAERPSNDAVIEVFDDMLDFDNNPLAAKAMKYRLFGTNVCPNNKHYEVIRAWMCMKFEALLKQCKVFEPVLLAMRKLLFKHEKSQKAVRVRAKTMDMDLSTIETFKVAMNGVIKHCLGKEKIYFENIEKNRRKRLKAKYSTKSKGDDSESDESGSNSDGSGSDDGESSEDSDSSDDGSSHSDDDGSNNHNKVCLDHILQNMYFLVTQQTKPRLCACRKMEVRNHLI